MTNPTTPETFHGLIRLPWFDDGLTMIRSHRFSCFVSPPCTGKTSFAFAAAQELTNKSPVVLPGSPEVELAHVFGHYVWTGNETRFVDGCLPLALKTAAKTGGCVLLVEEAGVIPLEVRAAFLALRGASQITNPQNGEVLDVPADSDSNCGLKVVFTSNPESLRCRQSHMAGIAKALWDDFVCYECPPISDRDAKRFLRHQYPQATAKRINRAMALWKDMRKVKSSRANADASGHLTYRACAHLLGLLEAGMNEDVAVRVSLVGKLMMLDEDLYSVAKLKATIA